jgi:hypothetical protein
MRLSDKVAIWLIVINFGTFTAPGLLILGVGGWILEPWWSPSFDDQLLSVSGSIGLLWPLGVPLIVRGLDRWRARMSMGLFSLVTVVVLYVWTVVVVLLVLVLLQQPVQT